MDTWTKTKGGGVEARERSGFGWGGGVVVSGEMQTTVTEQQ